MDDFDAFDALSELFKDLNITEEDLEKISRPLDDDRVQLVKDIAGKLSDGVGEGFDVSYGIDSPFPGTGYIKIVGERIDIRNTREFADACASSGDVDMFLENGKPAIEFTIHNKEER